MPIITDPSKLSMPEQVQKNKDDIETLQTTTTNQQTELDAKATSAELAQEVQDRKDADEALQADIDSIRDAQSVNAVVNSVGLNSDNLFIATKDGVAAPGNVPLNPYSNANLLSEAREYNGSQQILTGYMHASEIADKLEVIAYPLPIHARSQMTIDIDAALSYKPNLNFTASGINIGKYNNVGGTTNGTYVVKIKPFSSIPLAAFVVRFGDYSAGTHPYLEIVNTSELPTGVSFEKRAVNASSGTHYGILQIQNTITNAILIIFQVRDGVVSVNFDIER